MEWNVYYYNSTDAPGSTSRRWYQDIRADGHSLCSIDGEFAHFVNEESGNYRLTSSSSLIGRGTVISNSAIPEIQKDKDGKPRPAAGPWDIGPYQYVSVPCVYSISPMSESFGAVGGTGTVNVNTTSACPWTAVSNNSWITITSGASGTGIGTVRYSVAANTGGSRTGTVTVAGQTFTLYQDASVCAYSIFPVSRSISVAGGPGTVNVSTASGCGWTAVSNASWITVTSGSSGAGNGTVSYSVSANTGAARIGTMTIASKTFTVNQAAATCTYSISPTSGSFTSAGGTGTVNVSTASGCGWTAVSNNSWITVTSGSSGAGNGTVKYSVSANTGAARAGTMTIAGKTFTVNQASGLRPDISVSPTSIDFGYVRRGSSSTRPVTVSNTGGETLNISSISITGTNRADFRQTSNCSSLAPNGACTIQVTFTPPSGNGTRSATMAIYSNDPDESRVNVSLKGKGY